jgi:hypothetical protein
LNSQIAIIPQKNQQPRFIGRAVLGEESRTQEENTSRLPTNQQQTPTQATEEHLVRKPQLRVEANAGRNTTRRKYFRRPPDISGEEAMMDNDSPCNSMLKQARRASIIESINKEKRSRLSDVERMEGQPDDPYLRHHRLNGYGPLSERDIESIEAFVFFVGWQRSGHSIIGSLLDGHPDVVIAHEFLLFSHLHEFTKKRQDQKVSRKILFNQLVANSFRNARYGDRSYFHNEKGYNLKLSGSWQGCFRSLRILGDKAAGEVTNTYKKNTTDFVRHLSSVRSLVNLPLKVINVIRNPYDMIATLSLYRGSPVEDVKVEASVAHKYSNQKVIHGAADTILTKAHYLHMMFGEDYDWELIQIHSEDFIRDPTAIMREICSFLKLTCTKDYLTQCADKTFKSTSKSRELIEWDPVIRAQVENSIREIPFFRRYSFDDSD